MSTAKKMSTDDLGEIYQDLQVIPFFSHFPREFLHELASSCEKIVFDLGETILSQGQLNSFLYFLLDGRVSVLVDDGFVAELTKMGDILGEMSVITKKPCSATIVADATTTVLRLQSGFLEESTDKTDRFKFLLYKVYASMLAKKLDETNQQAKQLERLSLDLQRAQRDLQNMNASLEKKVQDRTLQLSRSHQVLEQQHLELVASHRKLEELYATKDKTFSHLEDLQKNYLIPLRASIKDLQGAGTTAPVVQQIDKTIGFLEPFSQLYSVEKSMKSKRVLLIEGQKKHQVLAKLALGGTGVDLRIIPSFDDFKKFEGSVNFDIVFVDLQTFLTEKNIAVRFSSSQIVVLVSDTFQESLKDLNQIGKLPCIVSRTDADRGFTIKNIGTTVAKLASQDIFGIEKYLAWGADVKSCPVVSSERRADYLQTMDAYFEQLGIRQTLRERAKLVAEEMLMNAIYDAPVGHDRVPLFNHMSRKEVVYLKPNQQGRMRYATDGLFVAVSIEDPFGSLEGRVVLDYLQNCYAGSVSDQRANKGGAGRGLHQILECSDLIVFNIHPGVKTEVIALFNLDPKSQAGIAPSFHMFLRR